MINLNNLSYSYSKNSPLVLKNINVRIDSGESVCVMGSNGSGKSTFAKLLTGLIEPDRGEIIISDDSNINMPVGLIFQDPDNQMVAVLVENEIAFSMENLNYPLEKMKANIEIISKSFNIEHLKRRITSELSGGEKQRVALASVMIYKPNILILDEPDSYLDLIGKETLKSELIRIKNKKPDMIQIHITQYPKTALDYDRLIIFHKGEIVADNKPYIILNDENFCRNSSLIYDSDDKTYIDFDRYYQIRKAAVDKIELNNISFEYNNDRPIFTDLNCSFHANEITGIAGLSGSGKSTLGLLLCRLLKPISGDIKYYNKDRSEIKAGELKGKIAALFQNPEKQFFLGTCTQEIAFGPDNFNQTISKDEINSLFDLVGLNSRELKDRDPLTLSGGEKRRLAFAAIIAMLPDFVIFDEPTCGLDPEGVGRFVDLVYNLRNKNMGIIIISHDGWLLNKLADRIILINSNQDIEFVSKNEFQTNQKLNRILKIE